MGREILVASESCFLSVTAVYCQLSHYVWHLIRFSFKWEPHPAFIVTKKARNYTIGF